MMYDMKKSDPAIVAEKPANKGPSGPAEPRTGPEGNPESQSTGRAQERETVTQAADRVWQAAMRDPEGGLVAFLHTFLSRRFGSPTSI